MTNGFDEATDLAISAFDVIVAAFFFAGLVKTNPSSSSSDSRFCPDCFAILSLDLRRFCGGELTSLILFFPLVPLGGVAGGESGYSLVCANFRFPFVVVTVVELVVVADFRPLIV